MNAIDLLISDHETVRGLFADFKSAAEKDDFEGMKSAQKKIFAELEVHTRIEEEIFYPAVRNTGVDELVDAVAESNQEHHVVDLLMREVVKLSDQEVFKAKMTVLIENVEHHADEEESDMFPEVKKQLSAEELDALGARLEAAK